MYNLGKKVSNTFTPRKSSSKKSFTSLGNIKPQTVRTATKPKFENQKVETEKLREDKSSQFTEGFLQNTPDIPTKKNRIIKPRIIKASDKFWEELGKKRIEIGKKGEMLVMEYERKRIISEEGKDFLDRLQYSALIEGDGLGYDITFFEKGCKIYIEVKTTTGSFWNGLFFTHTELSTMEKLENKYYLYRIYEFDKLTNMGKLKIFKGCEEIQSQFDFSPQTYILKPKV